MTRLARTLVAIALLGPLAVSGCWGLREIETLAIITAAGIDLVSDGGLIQVTVQIAKPRAIGAGSSATGGGGESHLRAFWVVSAKGRTVSEAIDGLARLSPRRIFWSHATVLVFGEEAARAGLAQYLDFFARDGESRPTTKVLTVKGDTAAKLLEGEFELEVLPSQGLLGLARSGRGAFTALDANLNDLAIALEEDGLEPVTAGVEMVPKIRSPEEGPAGGAGSGNLEGTTIPWSPVIQGGAVYRGDSLVGWLTEVEARGVAWVTGRVAGSTIVLSLPERAMGDSGVNIAASRGGMRPTLEGGKLKMKVKVTAEGVLSDARGYADPFWDPYIVPALEERLAVAVAGEIQNAVARAKEMKADVFGFGAAIHRSLPKKWRELKDRWAEEFVELDVEVEVKAYLRHTGKTTRTVRQR